MARPEAKIDLAELEKLAGMQCTNEEIGAFFGVSKRTIVRRCNSEKFRDIIEQGRAKGRVSVRRALFKLANAGNVAAAIFLSKNLLGYKDYFSNEHSGPEGGPIPVSVVEALHRRRNQLALERKGPVGAQEGRTDAPPA